MTRLDDAFLEVCRRRDECDAAGDADGAHLLRGIADVLDHLGRIADTAGSAYYRADKTAALVLAALQVRREALLAYVGPDADALTTDWLHDLTGIAADIEERIAAVMWGWATRRPTSGTEKRDDHD